MFQLIRIQRSTFNITSVIFLNKTDGKTIISSNVYQACVPQ